MPAWCRCCAGQPWRRVNRAHRYGMTCKIKDTCDRVAVRRIHDSLEALAILFAAKTVVRTLSKNLFEVFIAILTITTVFFVTQSYMG